MMMCSMTWIDCIRSDKARRPSMGIAVAPLTGRGDAGHQQPSFQPGTRCAAQKTRTNGTREGDAVAPPACLAKAARFMAGVTMLSNIGAGLS